MRVQRKDEELYESESFHCAAQKIRYFFRDNKSNMPLKEFIYRTISEEMDLQSIKEFQRVFYLLRELLGFRENIPSLSTIRRDLKKLDITNEHSHYYKYPYPIYEMRSDIESDCINIVEKGLLSSIYISVNRGCEDSIATKLFDIYNSEEYFFSVEVNIGSIKVLSDDEFILEQIESCLEKILHL